MIDESIAIGTLLAYFFELDQDVRLLDIFLFCTFIVIGCFPVCAPTYNKVGYFGITPKGMSVLQVLYFEIQMNQVCSGPHIAVKSNRNL